MYVPENVKIYYGMRNQNRRAKIFLKNKIYSPPPQFKLQRTPLSHTNYHQHKTMTIYSCVSRVFRIYRYLPCVPSRDDASDSQFIYTLLSSLLLNASDLLSRVSFKVPSRNTIEIKLLFIFPHILHPVNDYQHSYSNW